MYKFRREFCSPLRSKISQNSTALSTLREQVQREAYQQIYKLTWKNSQKKKIKIHKTKIPFLFWLNPDTAENPTHRPTMTLTSPVEARPLDLAGED
jgi:hypothetical protein